MIIIILLNEKYKKKLLQGNCYKLMIKLNIKN
jgi:hypothetical protein